MIRVSAVFDVQVIRRRGDDEINAAGRKRCHAVDAILQAKIKACHLAKNRSEARPVQDFFRARGVAGAPPSTRPCVEGRAPRDRFPLTDLPLNYPECPTSL